MSSLCWLHLSDIHFRPSSEWSDATARNALLEHLRDTISKHSLAIDLIFCTGDIAFGELRGQPLAGQYALAQKFFDELRQVCGDLPAGRVFVVPGNHDVNRNAVDPHAQAHWYKLASDAQSETSRISQEFAANSGSARFALKRMAEYGDFVGAAFPHQQAPAGHHHYARVVDIRGCKVGIGGFNSAWTCAGPEDDRNLWLAAEAQFNHMRAALEPADLRIGLIHHPGDSFNLADRRTLEARSKADFDFWLHGHTHDLGLFPHAEGVRICAGATAADSAAESGYTIVRFDPASGEGSALLFDYDKSGRARWKPFTVASVAENGEQAFTLQRLAPKTPPAAAITHPIATQQTPPPAANPPLFSRPLPPAGPCLERETELARLAGFTSATPPRPVLIHGYGGLGKTEIASACLHSPAARACFGARRLFVSVEALEGTAAADLPARLRQHLDFALFNGALGPTTSIADGLFAALQAGGPALLVLDNFETVVKIDAAHAAELLDQLAPLADAGLALVVTLREPLAQPRSRFASIAPQPLAAPADRHLLCHWMGLPAGAALSPRDESALCRLLQLAEGWPIQLQMLGILAAIEGLPALAKRCPDGAGLMQLADDQPGRDAHRHPLLSNRLTYDAPSLGDAARSLLRVLAQFPAGLPDDWLEHWPDQAAVRAVLAHKLLATVPGALGEARCKLHAPLRDYLLHAQPLQTADRALLGTTARAWWQAQAPELFDDALQQRQSAATYRDLHRREVSAIATLRGLGTGPLEIFARLEGRVGDVDDWPQRCAALRAQVLSSAEIFPSPEDAEHFAWLLAGSQSISSATKESIASLISEKLLPASHREALHNVFASELDAWSWEFGSRPLADRMWQHLATGEVCFQASDEALLTQVSLLTDRDEQIALLHLTIGPENPPRQTYSALNDALTCSPESPVAVYVAAERSSGAKKLAHLHRAVELAPDFGNAWRSLALALPDDAPDKPHAWQATLRCAAAHLAQSQQHGILANEVIYQALFDAQHTLGLSDEARATLNQRQASLDDFTTAMQRVRLAIAFQQAGQNADAARQLQIASLKATPIEADNIRRLAARIANSAPAQAGEVFLVGLYPRFGASQDLYAAARLLFYLNQPDAGFTLAERAASDPALTPEVANNFAYALLTRSKDDPASIELSARLAAQGFSAEPTLPHAETLLCATLRAPDAVRVPLRQDALARLLAVTEDAPDEDVFQLAGLLFDARRLSAIAPLAAWLADSPEALREGPAGQWLATRLANESAPPSPLAARLDATLPQIAAQLVEQSTWAEAHASDGEALAELVESLFDDAPELDEDAKAELKTLMAELAPDDPMRALMSKFLADE